MIVVDLALATICFANSCYPALIGKDTPTGVFSVQQRLTESAGYDGDVLQFKETDTEVFAIHRVWTLKPSERRISRLQSKNPADRRITNGCINVMPEVYNKLLDCCSADQLIIR